ncbi:MAG: redoxin domain-containing protein [Limisphaerales bacterium]
MDAAETTSCGCRMWRKAILGVGILLIPCLWFFRGPIAQRAFTRAVLANDAPAAEVEQNMIQNAADPHAAIVAAWNTGKIAHRHLAIQEISGLASHGQTLSAAFRSILLAGALDPDLDVREIALSALDERADPALAALSAAQLSDLDPQVRLLGLMHLRKVSARAGLPTVAPLLTDTNPQILAYVVKLMADWSGENFGVRLADAVPEEDAKTGLTVFDKSSYEKTRAGANRATAWWQEHRAEFPHPSLQIPREALDALQPVYAGQFVLPGLDGKPVRLSDFHGKTVLINFWATWCTACISELPALIALQKNHHDPLAILGVSLDFVPDEDNRDAAAAPEDIRRKVARTIAARGVNYPVLLDKDNEVGARFNGGELPTTVIIDSEGRVRRRFVGTRSLPVFEAMVAEASHPMPPMRVAESLNGAR